MGQIRSIVHGCTYLLFSAMPFLTGHSSCSPAEYCDKANSFAPRCLASRTSSETEILLVCVLCCALLSSSNGRRTHHRIRSPLCELVKEFGDSLPPWDNGNNVQSQSAESKGGDILYRAKRVVVGEAGEQGGVLYSKWQSLVVNRVRHPQKNIIYAMGHTKSYYSTAATPLAKPPSPEYCCSDPSHSLSPARSFSIVLHDRHSLFSGPYRFRDEFLGGLLHIYYVCLCASFILFSRLGNSCLCLWLLLAFTTVQPAKTKKEYI